MALHYEMGAPVVHDLWLYGPAGNFGRWASSVHRGLVRNAVKSAPTGANTGRVNKSRANAHEPVGSLKAGIDGSSGRIGPRQLQVTLSSSASYTMYVVKGTSTIWAKSARIPKGEPGAGQFKAGGGMYIPANPGWGKSMFRQRVRGQRANNFFAEAFRLTAIQHSSLRGQSGRMG